MIAAALAPNILGGDTVGAGHLIDDAVDGDRQRGLLGHDILDGVFGQQHGDRRSGQIGVGIQPLDNALQLADIILQLAGDEGRNILWKGKSQAIRLTADDGHAGLKIRG